MKYRLFTLSLFLFSFAAHADVTISMSHETNGNNVDTTLSFSSDRVRMDAVQGGVILTPSRDEMIMLMHGQKQYMKRSLSQTASMSPQSTALTEKITFQKTGKQQEINGFNCEQVIGTEADGDVIEFWVSKDSVHTDKFLSAMQAFHKLQNNAQGGNQMDAWNQFFESNPELSTFPIRTINKNASGVVESVTTVKSISEDSIPASRFEVPAGYTPLATAALPAPGEVSTATPTVPNAAHSEVIKELQALQQEIKQNGGQPTAAQMKRLQELASKFKAQ